MKTIPNQPGYYANENGEIFSSKKGGLQKRALAEKPNGYLQVTLNQSGKKINKMVSRLVAETYLPDYNADLEVDHINGVKTDNRPENLRMFSCSDNHRAFRVKSPNASSRYRGVTWDKERSTWMASIRLNGVSKFLGRFKTEREAAGVFNRAAVEFGFHPEALNKLAA